MGGRNTQDTKKNYFQAVDPSDRIQLNRQVIKELRKKFVKLFIVNVGEL